MNGKTVFHFQVLSCIQMGGKSNSNGYLAKIWTHRKVAFLHLFIFICYRIEQKNPLFDRSKSKKSPLFSAIKNFINVTINSSTSLLSFQVEVNIHKTCHFIWVSNSICYWGNTHNIHTHTHKTHECVSAWTLLLIHQSAIWHLDTKHVIML